MCLFAVAPGLHPEKTQHDDDADSVKDFRLDGNSSVVMRELFLRFRNLLALCVVCEPHLWHVLLR